MDRAAVRLSFISVILAEVVIAFFGLYFHIGGVSVSLAEPNYLQEGDLVVAGLDMVTAVGNAIGAGPGGGYAGTIKSGSAALTYGEDGNPVLTLNNFVYEDHKVSSFMSGYIDQLYCEPRFKERLKEMA